jgi:hypothetical protein
VIAPETQVWRLAGFGRSITSVMLAVLTVMTVALWVQAAMHTSLDGVLEALRATAVAAGAGLFLWWVALHPKLVLTTDEVVAVNPWGTQRVAVADVAAVTRSLFGARLELRSGWSVTVFALAESYGGGFRRGQRNAQVVDAIRARQRALGVG